MDQTIGANYKPTVASPDDLPCDIPTDIADLTDNQGPAVILLIVLRGFL